MFQTAVPDRQIKYNKFVIKGEKNLDILSLRHYETFAQHCVSPKKRQR
jgi:hypothetical protein